MDINIVLSILSWLTGSIVGVTMYKQYIVDNVINKGQYFIQTKDGCFIVMEAMPEGEVVMKEGTGNEE